MFISVGLGFFGIIKIDFLIDYMWALHPCFEFNFLIATKSNDEQTGQKKQQRYTCMYVITRKEVGLFIVNWLYL